MDRQKRSSKGSVGVETFQNRLRLRLPRQLYDGKQKYLTLGFEDTPSNRKVAEAKAKQIESDIVLEKFDHTLSKYRPDHAKSVELPKAVDLSELWERYTQFKASQVEKSTLLRDYGKIGKRIQKLPVQSLDRPVVIRDFLLKAYSAEVAKRTLKQINACCNWAIRSKLIESNPFLGMAGEIKTKKSSNSSRTPFAREEREAIVRAFENNTYCSRYSPLKHSYYAAYVRFLFLTGCRPEEAIALKWKHVQSNQIIFCEAVATDVRIRKDTKTHESRSFPINAQLGDLLEAIKPPTVDSETLVFPARGGKEIDAHNFLNRTWKPIVERLVEDEKVKHYLPQYNCRHTFITLCLEAGVSVVQIARWVGNSPEIIMKHYAGIIKNVEVPEF